MVKKKKKSYHIAENLEHNAKGKKQNKTPYSYYLNPGASTSGLSAYFFLQNFKNVSISFLPLHLNTVA